MGCCNKKSKIQNRLELMMNNFYFRVVDLEFVVSQIKEYNSKQKKNYHEFWALTKLLGVHSDIYLQVHYWESTFVNYSEESLHGLLFIFVLLCKGDLDDKLIFLKFYLSTHINLSKQNDTNLVLNLYDFKKILYVYFACLTIAPLNTLLKINKIEEHKQVNLMKEKFSKENIERFVDFCVKKYSKKNFYINAGKFFDEKIKILANDKLVRSQIIRFNSQIDMFRTLEADNENQREDFGANFLTENKPLRANIRAMPKKKVFSCFSAKELLADTPKTNKVNVA